MISSSFWGNGKLQFLLQPAKNLYVHLGSKIVDLFSIGWVFDVQLSKDV